MIVEDEQYYHDLYSRMLKDTNYAIISVYDGEEALSTLERKKPDLIIIDMIMDMMTGDTLFLYLKGMPEYQDIPVIILSNQSSRSYKNLRKIDRNLAFLNKAFTKDRLIEEISAKIG